MYQAPTGFKMLPDVIKNLLIINGIFFLATIILPGTFGINLSEKLGLFFPLSDQFYPYQIVTHMFMHGGIMHILLNMFALWMFGYALENVWGSKRFLIYYMVTGLGAAFLHLGVNYIEYYQIKDQLTPEQLEIIIKEGRGVIKQGMAYSNPVMEKANHIINIPTVGASGAVFGILLAFGMMFPNVRMIMIFFPIPIKAKYFVMGYAAVELYNGIANRPGDNIAHFAHLGGMLFGYLLIRHWRRNSYDKFY